jgi:hypothetical protein
MMWTLNLRGVPPFHSPFLCPSADRCCSRVELGLNASEEDLSALANACDADLGTLGERTMDHTKFSPRLDVVSSGLLDVISKDILEGQNADKLLRAELSHLKVYGSHFLVQRDLI